jgi:hypothetical protein
MVPALGDDAGKHRHKDDNESSTGRQHDEHDPGEDIYDHDSSLLDPAEAWSRSSRNGSTQR